MGIRDQCVCGTVDRAADYVRCGLPAEGGWPGMEVTAEVVGPLCRFGHCAEHALTAWRQTVPRAPIELCQHSLADQDRDREDSLPIGCGDRQRDRCTAQADQ